MRQKAQSIMEYVALLAIVSVALATMQLYFKQGIQSGIKEFADYIGSQKKGSAEDEYQYKWFTNGEKGLRGTSIMGSRDTGSANTTFDDKVVKYERDDKTEQGRRIGIVGDLGGAIAHWSVGIERERARGKGDR